MGHLFMHVKLHLVSQTVGIVSNYSRITLSRKINVIYKKNLVVKYNLSILANIDMCEPTHTFAHPQNVHYLTTFVFDIPINT